MVIVAGPGVASAIRNQFNQVSDAIGSGTVGENFYDAVDLPDPQNGTAFAVYSEDDHSLMFYKRRGVPKVGDMFNYRRASAIYTGIETDTYSGNWPQDNCPWNGYADAIKLVRIVDDGIKPHSMAYWFCRQAKCYNFENLGKIDTSECVSLERTFSHSGAFYLPGLEKWNIGNVRSIGCIFDGCTGLTSISDQIKGWDTSAVRDCNQAFYGCSQLKFIDLSKWKIIEKETGQAVFWNCQKLEQLDLSGFDFREASNAWNLFVGCDNLKMVTFGENWRWKGTSCYLPAPSAKYIDGADGKWYALSDGKAYRPSEIPVEKADTYFASRAMRDYQAKLHGIG